MGVIDSIKKGLADTGAQAISLAVDSAISSLEYKIQARIDHTFRKLALKGILVGLCFAGGLLILVGAVKFFARFLAVEWLLIILGVLLINAALVIAVLRK